MVVYICSTSDTSKHLTLEDVTRVVGSTGFKAADFVTTSDDFDS